MAIEFKGGKATPINQITNRNQQMAKDEAAEALRIVAGKLRFEAKRLQELGLIAAGNSVMDAVAYCNRAEKNVMSVR